MPTSSKVSSSSKTKKSSKSTAVPNIVKTFKSAELIKDSDDEDVEQHVRTPRNPLKTSTVTESKPKVRPISVKPISAIPNGKTSKKLQRDGRSSQITISSDSQSGKEEEKVKNSGLDEESGDEERREGSSTGSESETDSTSGDDDGKDKSQSKMTAPTIPQKQAASQKPVAQYELPSGFEPATITIPSSSRLTDLFSSDSLRTKQLWHIIVPSSVPLNSISEVSTESVKSGSSILTHGGADYGLITKVQDQSAKKVLLLPVAEANEYKSAKVGISKTLNLQQIIPDRRHGPSTISTSARHKNQTSNYEKPARQQPKGLKIRYRPFGDTEDSSEESGFESSPKHSKRALQFRKPISLETSSSSKKNMNQVESDIEMGGDTESAMKKGRKDRHADSLDVAGAFHTELQKDRTASPKVSKKRKNYPESERGGTERPVKKIKSEVALEPLPEGRISPYSSTAVHLRGSKASKGSKKKRHANIERNNIETSAKSQKDMVPSETVAVPKMPLLDDELDRMRKPTKTLPYEKEVSTNEYSEDTIMLDPTPSISLKTKDEDVSHNGKHLNSQPIVLIVRNETKQDDEIIVEPIKEKQKPKKDRRRERSEETEQPPAGDATRSTADMAKEAKNTTPAAEILTDTPTTAIKTDNSMTAEELKSQRRKERKERKRRKQVEESNNIIPASKNTHPLGTANTSTPAAPIENRKAPPSRPPSSAPAVTVSPKPATPNPEHQDSAATTAHSRKRKHEERRKRRIDAGEQDI